MAELKSEVEDASELKFGPIFDKPIARALSNSEALQVLNQTQQMRKDDDASYVPTPIEQQTKQYLERFNTVKHVHAIEAMTQIMADADVKGFERCAIINLLPGTAEEAKALIPSLETIGDRFEDEESLKALLDRVQTLRDL